MKIRSLFYHIKDGLKNIYRNRLFSLASIATIAACIFLFGILYSLVMNFQYMVKRLKMKSVLRFSLTRTFRDTD